MSVSIYIFIGEVSTLRLRPPQSFLAGMRAARKAGSGAGGAGVHTRQPKGLPAMAVRCPLPPAPPPTPVQMTRQSLPPLLAGGGRRCALCRRRGVRVLCQRSGQGGAGAGRFVAGGKLFKGGGSFSDRNRACVLEWCGGYRAGGKGRSVRPAGVGLRGLCVCAERAGQPEAVPARADG